MKKKVKSNSFAEKLKQNRVLRACLTVLFILAVAFIFRGWIRMTVIPSGVRAFYGNPAEKVYKAELEKLQGPLAILGYSEDDVELRYGDCKTIAASGISTKVSCNYGIRVYRVLEFNENNVTNIKENSEKLQNLLKEEGWIGEYNNEESEHISLESLATKLTERIDNGPVAVYQKTVDGVVCYFTNTTAFNNPNNPAIASQISCDRNFFILGRPNYLF